MQSGIILCWLQMFKENTMDPVYIQNEITINGTPENVWKALTDPQITKQYMFGCEVMCAWNIGDPILWKGAADGVVYVKGKLVAFDPPKKFSFTVFDPMASYPDIPDNYLTATYTLEQQGQTTLLKVSQGDYASVAEGSKRYQDTKDQGGWTGVLAGIRDVVEQD